MKVFIALLFPFIISSESMIILSVTPEIAEITQTISLSFPSKFLKEFTIFTRVFIFDDESNTDPPNFIIILISTNYMVY